MPFARIRTWSVRTLSWVGSRPNMLERAIAMVVFVLLCAALLILLLPLLVIGALVAAAFGLRATARTILGAARRPNGLLDGRRNVRVVDPSQPRDVL